jgi:cytochrome c peroxidase
MNFKFRLTLVLILIISVCSIITNACRKSSVGSNAKTTPLNFVAPGGFPEPVYDFSSNPLTEEGFALGRKLFHDHTLSKNADVTCNSCHQQQAAYTTFDHDLGHGTNHQHTTRNVPVIFNMVWQHEFQWDGSVLNLEEQPLKCMTAPEKMGEEVNSVVSKLSTDNEYRKMFAKAFGDENISGERIAKALTQFVVMIVSANSKYDKMKRGEATFDASEQNGYEIFKSKCSSCHTEPLFKDLSYRNTGLPVNPFHPDYGRMMVTGNTSDSLKFKVPSLRNVGLTGYYTHDGRFVYFSEMLDHYINGVQQGPTLDPLLKNNIPLTDLEKFYVQQFLYTLDDSTLVTDPRFE